MKAFCAAAALGWLALTASAPAAGRPIAFEDVLNAETLGDARFSPDGQWLVFAREMPVAGHPTWGYFNAAYVRTRVFVARADGRDMREIVNTKDVHYALVPRNFSWAPDGRGLLLIAARQNSYGLAYYDLAKRRVTELPGRSVYTLFSWMPDGRILYVTAPDGERQRDLHLPLLDGLDRRWRAAWTASAPQVTVSSSSSVFPDAPQPDGALRLADPHAGSSRIIAKGNFLEVSASKDGRFVAAVKLAEDRSDALSGAGERGELDVFDTRANAPAVYRNTDDDLSPYDSLAWSPTGDVLLFAARPLHDDQGHALDYGRDLKSGQRLYEADIHQGRARLLSAADLSFGDPDLNSQSVLPIGWMQGVPVAIAAHHVTGAAPATTQATARLEYGTARDTRFDLFAFDGTTSENLTAFAKRSVNRFFAPESAAFAFVVADGALWKVAPDKPAQRVTPQDAPPILDFGADRGTPASNAYYRTEKTERISLATIAGRSIARSVFDSGTGKLMALTVPGDIIATAPDQLTTLSKVTDGWAANLDLNDGASRTLLTVNAGLKDRAVAQAQRFTFTCNGQSLTGWVLLPPEGGTKLPAIVSVYGGAVFGDQPPPFVRTDLGPPVLRGQLLAQQGYAVIYPSTPLGQGSSSDLMKTLADETVAAVDALAAQGTIDPAHVGIMGQSFGGYSTAAILSERSDRFQAGVALAGAYDFIHGYGLRSMELMLDDDENMLAPETMLIETSQAQLGAPFWETPDAYMRNSPIFRADKIDAPLLLLHGDLDLAVTGLSGAERLYNAMLRAGKHPTLVRYWGEGHVAQSDWAMRDQWMRITTWFGVYVKGEKPPPTH